MHLRRALLLFAIVLGLTAVAATIAPPGREAERDERAASPPAPPQRLKEFRFRYPPAESPPAFPLAVGRHVILRVDSDRPGEVELVGLGLVQSVDRRDPAVFDLLLERPGRFDAVLTPVRGRRARVGRLVVTD